MWSFPINRWYIINTFRRRQNCRDLADDMFKCIFLNENIWIAIKISLKIDPNGPFNNIPALDQLIILGVNWLFLA